VAGGCGHAEELEELFEVLFELVEDLRELGEVLCATVAGGCGHAEELEEPGEVTLTMTAKTGGPRYGARPCPGTRFS
jgi:hypothetical protein